MAFMAFIRKNVNCRDWYPYTRIKYGYKEFIRTFTAWFLIIS